MQVYRSPAPYLFLFLICLVLSGVAFTLIPSTIAFSQVNTLTFKTGENYADSAVIDSVGGYAYFGTFTNPGTIIKVRLSDFTQVSNLTLNAGESYLRTSSVIDPAGGYAYFGTDTSPGLIVKIRLSDFTRAGALNTDQNLLETALIDAGAGFAYFGTYTTPGVIVKVRLSDFTVNATLTLNSGENLLYASAIDPAAGYAYFGTDTNPGIIVKVRLSNFTRVSALTLNTGEGFLRSAVLDQTAGFAYFGTFTSPGIIVKIRLSDFSEVASLMLPSADPTAGLRTAVIDPIGGFAYFVDISDTIDYLAKIRLTTLTQVANLTASGILVSSVFDAGTGYAYFGAGTTPGRVQKVQVASAPAAPTMLRATKGQTQVSLSWTAPSFNGDRNLTGYNIYRGTSPGTETLLKTIGNTTTYVDNQLTPGISCNSAGITCYYKVTALNNFGESAPSNEASTAQVPTLQPVPMVLTALSVASVTLTKLRSRRRA
jgi:hypothetical protein